MQPCTRKTSLEVVPTTLASFFADRSKFANGDFRLMLLQCKGAAKNSSYSQAGSRNI